MISVKVEMHKIEEVCVIKVVGGEDHLPMRVENEHGEEVWYNDLHDIVFPDNEVVEWEYFFPN